MASLGYVVDINGKSGPNSQEASKRNDIRSFNGAKFGTGCAGFMIDDMCVYELESYDPVTDASKSSYISTYCASHPSWGCTDYWLGAIDACKNIDMHLATQGELNTIYAHKGEPKVPEIGWRWVSAEQNTLTAWIKLFSNGNVSYEYKNFQVGALCVGN